jgi:hypothetical protein
MVVDKDGNPVPHFQVGKTYTGKTDHECADLGEAVFYATAVAMHRGYPMEVRRAVPRDPNGPLDTFQLFSVSPNSIDYRKVKPETVLGMKAMAHSLVANIDEVAPEPIQEGFSQ